MRGGKRAGAGRKKNVPNRAIASRERKVAASGETPLDVLLRAMRLLSALADESANDKKQFEHYIRAAAAVAKDVAPFIHPRISTMEQSTANRPEKIIVEVIGGLPVGSTPENPGGTEYSEVPAEETQR
jgi:methanogenic corrinoid protein MtbC1